MIQTDKWAHFGLSGMLTILVFSFHMDWWLAGLIVWVLGLFKEIRDMGHRAIPVMDVGDLVANALGIGAGIICLRRILFLVWL